MTRIQKKYQVTDTIMDKVVFVGTVQEIADYLGCFYNTVYVYARNYLLYKNRYEFVDLYSNDLTKEGYKICIHCGREMPEDKFVPGRNTCKECRADYYRRRNENRKRTISNNKL